MSTLSDALTALKNVVLMQERLDVVRREITELAATASKQDDRINSINERLIRIETMIEMSGGGRTQPRLEG